MRHEINSSDDQIDVRDVIARIEELENDRGDTEHAAWAAENPTDAAELELLSALMGELAGYDGDEQWRGDWYPITLIRDSYFVEAMQELCEDIGDFPNGVPSYYVIDWEATARNLRVNYSSVEFDGVTYWYR
jgi:antirestriction protein